MCYTSAYVIYEWYLMKIKRSGWTMSKLFEFLPCKTLSHFKRARKSLETTSCTSIWCRKLNCNNAIEITIEVLSLSTTPSISRRNLWAKGLVKDFWTDKDSNLNSFLHLSTTSTINSGTWNFHSSPTLKVKKF